MPGRLEAPAFYVTVDGDSVRPYMPGGVSYLLPATSFWESRTGKLRPPRLPDHLQDGDIAADCGGFVATLRWGEYRYSMEQYIDWLGTIRGLRWAATMDWCCEPDITAADRGLVAERQEMTAEAAERFLELYGDAPWTWVPTIQGWDVDDYRRAAERMAPGIRFMQSYYYERPGMLLDCADEDEEPPAWSLDNLSAFRVGIGTLCRRASTEMIGQVVAAISAILPGVPLHLWGVKLGYLQRAPVLPSSIVSFDSAAWNGRQKPSVRTEYRDSGLTQREYAYRVALPRYLAKVRAALEAPRKLPLALCPDTVYDSSSGAPIPRKPGGADMARKTRPTALSAATAEKLSNVVQLENKRSSRRNAATLAVEPNDIGGFENGRNRGTKTCVECGKRTWDSRVDGSTGLCPDCYERAGLENEHMDGRHDDLPQPADNCPLCEALPEPMSARPDDEAPEREEPAVFPAISEDERSALLAAHGEGGHEAAADGLCPMCAGDPSMTTSDLQAEMDAAVLKARAADPSQARYPSAPRPERNAPSSDDLALAKDHLRNGHDVPVEGCAFCEPSRDEQASAREVAAAEVAAEALAAKQAKKAQRSNKRASEIAAEALIEVKADRGKRAKRNETRVAAPEAAPAPEASPVVQSIPEPESEAAQVARTHAEIFGSAISRYARRDDLAVLVEHIRQREDREVVRDFVLALAVELKRKPRTQSAGPRQAPEIVPLGVAADQGQPASDEGVIWKGTVRKTGVRAWILDTAKAGMSDASGPAAVLCGHGTLAVYKSKSHAWTMSAHPDTFCAACASAARDKQA